MFAKHHNDIIHWKFTMDEELIYLFDNEENIKFREGNADFLLMYKEVVRVGYFLNGIEPVLREKDEYALELLYKYKIRKKCKK